MIIFTVVWSEDRLWFPESVTASGKENDIVFMLKVPLRLSHCKSSNKADLEMQVLMQNYKVFYCVNMAVIRVSFHGFSGEFQIRKLITCYLF